MASEYVTRDELEAAISELALHGAIEGLREEMRAALENLRRQLVTRADLEAVVKELQVIKHEVRIVNGNVGQVRLAVRDR